MPDPFERQEQHELFFSSDPPGQAGRAFELLKGLEGLRVEPGSQTNSLLVSYSLRDYSMEGLETALTREGFHLDGSIWHSIGRTLVHYCEEVQYHNLSTPERKTKSREREIFVNAYEHHPHGDHDDTPEELREYK
jgi:hypothetical protein